MTTLYTATSRHMKTSTIIIDQSQVIVSVTCTPLWLGIEQCSNRRRNLVPEESGPRFERHMHQKSVPEKMERIYWAIGASLWRVCHGRDVTTLLIVLSFSCQLSIMLSNRRNIQAFSSNNVDKIVWLELTLMLTSTQGNSKCSRQTDMTFWGQTHTWPISKIKTIPIWDWLLTPRNTLTLNVTWRWTIKNVKNLSANNIQCESKKIPPSGVLTFLIFLTNGWEFLINFYTPIIRSYLR